MTNMGMNPGAYCLKELSSADKLRIPRVQERRGYKAEVKKQKEEQNPKEEELIPLNFFHSSVIVRE